MFHLFLEKVVPRSYLLHLLGILDLLRLLLVWLDVLPLGLPLHHAVLHLLLLHLLLMQLLLLHLELLLLHHQLLLCSLVEWISFV